MQHVPDGVCFRDLAGYPQSPLLLTCINGYLVELFEVPGEDPFVVLLLQGGHWDPQDAFILGRQALLHILDDTPQELWAEQGMQMTNLQLK